MLWWRGTLLGVYGGRAMTLRPISRRRLAALLVGLFIVLIAAAVPASAHALLVATNPGIGSQLEVPPTQVTLTFDEGVVASDRSIVVTAGGQRLDTGAPTHPGGAGTEISVQLKPGPTDASYAVLWRVGSADGHAVDGSFSFGVGRPAGPAPSLSAVAGSGAVAGVDDIAQAVAYLALTVALGAAFTVGTLWPAATRLARVRTLIAGGWVAEVFATLVLLVLRGPVTAGTGITTVGSADTFHTTVDTRSGRLLIVRLVVLGLLLPALRRLLGRGEGSAFDLALLGILLIVSFPLGDHAGTGSDVPLAVSLGALHVLAAVVWLGGLAVLALVLLKPDAAPLDLGRWSKVAAGCVAVIVATGAIASLREVGSWAALVHTGYGVTLLVKIALLVLLLVVADFSRRGVRRGQTLSLRRGVAIEAGLGVLILAVTAVLVGAQPARDSYAAPLTLRVPLTDAASAPMGVGLVRFDRTRLGSETLTVTLLDRSGQPVTAGSLGGVLSDIDTSDNPLRFPFLAAGPAGAVASVELPETGRWTLSLDVRGLPGGDLAGSAQFRVT